FCDGSWKYSGAVAATVIHSPSGVKTSYAAKLEFDSTNNVAEYKAIIPELRKLKAMGVKRAILMSDSQVITGHVEKTAKAKEERLEKIPSNNPKNGSTLRRIHSEKHNKDRE